MVGHRHGGVFAVAVGLALLGTPTSARAAETVVFKNARLLDPASGRLQAETTVVVRDGRIASIGGADAAGASKDVKDIDASGKVLVPGLVDLSVAAFPGPARDADFFAALGLAHGVLHYVVVGGRTAWAKEQQQRVAGGEVVSPQLHLSGPLVAASRVPPGPAPADLSGYVPPLVVGDAQAALAAVDRLATSGIQWVRLSEGLPGATARAVVAGARRHRLRVSVRAEQAPLQELLSWRPDVVEGLGAFQPAGTARPQPRNGAPPVTAIESWQRARPQDVVADARRLAASGVTLVPMLRWLVGRLGLGEPDVALLEARARELLPGSTGQHVPPSDTVAVDASVARGAWRNYLAFVKAWSEAGGRIGTASGAAQDALPLPGLAIHEEVAILMTAGLSSAEAIRAAILPASDLLGGARSWTAGRPANFFLVAGDPLADLANLRTIEGVIRAGEWFSPDHLIAQARRAVTRR